MRSLTDEELVCLLKAIGSDHVEKKQSFSGDVPDKARQAVCAFANDLPNRNKPGVLFIGANDNGTSSGISITDELLRNIGEMKVDGNILPLPVMLVEKRELCGADFAVVTVFASDSPPVRYKGRTWVRIGPRRSIASLPEERILNEKRRYKDASYDLHAVSAASVSDLSRAMFEDDYLPSAFSPEELAENGRSLEEKLASCKMIVSPDDPTPTVCGILALGKRPQDFLPGAYIQFLRLDGTELVDPVVDEAVINGPLVPMLRRLDDKLIAHNRISYDITSQSTHRTAVTYPLAALQQLVYNAVAHRVYEGTNSPIRVYWYDDRIEITSPGGTFGQVTAENFGQPGITDYRNPNVAAAMKVFGVIQAFGRGILIAKSTLAQHGNPPPVFQIDNTNIVCQVFQKPTITNKNRPF